MSNKYILRPTHLGRQPNSASRQRRRVGGSEDICLRETEGYLPIWELRFKDPHLNQRDDIPEEGDGEDD